MKKKKNCEVSIGSWKYELEWRLSATVQTPSLGVARKVLTDDHDNSLMHHP